MGDVFEDIKSKYTSNLIILGIILLIIVTTIGYLRSIKFHGIKDFYHANFGDFSVAYCTILLAIATFYLAFSEIRERRKDRRCTWLKEQLQFYAKLEAGIHGLEKESSKNLFLYLQKHQEIRELYPILAEPKLKKLFDKVFPYIASDIEDSYRFTVAYMREIVKIVDEKFEKLKEKYEKECHR